MKTYFITGGCGFIGSNFIHYLIKNKIAGKIINLDKLTYAGNKDNLSSIEDNDNYFFIKGDISNEKVVQNILRQHTPDVIVNFAAESHVDRSIDNPVEFIKTNVLGTSNLLNESCKWIKSMSVEAMNDFKFIQISTDEVYGSLGSEGSFTESTAYNPSSAYSASKASSDHLARSWFKTYNFPVIITNCSNNYGPYQFPEKLIPLMIINALSEKKLPIYGKGLNVRDWLYVEDHCKAIYKVIEKGKPGQTYNIGGNNEITNIQIVNTICAILDKEIPLKSGKLYKESIIFVEDRPGHDFRYAVNSTKIKKELGWDPKESFESGIQKTILWYLSNKSWWEKIQIQNYNQERLGLLK